MTEIPLTKGKVALVDDEDVARVMAHRWYATQKNRPNGPPLWYATTRDGTVFLHRFVLGSVKGQRVDHINGDGLDCQRVNMRYATASQNNANQRPRLKKKWSVYKGVGRYINRIGKMYWRAQIKAGGVRRSLYFKTEREAALAYNELARTHFGEFARLNEVA